MRKHEIVHERHTRSARRNLATVVDVLEKIPLPRTWFEVA